MKTYYVVTNNGGHAKGGKVAMETICLIPGWRMATHSEYLEAQRKARSLDDVASRVKPAPAESAADD